MLTQYKQVINDISSVDKTTNHSCKTLANKNFMSNVSNCFRKQGNKTLQEII